MKRARAIRKIAGGGRKGRKDWGVAAFGQASSPGCCDRCQRDGRVFWGYNGGKQIMQACGDCRLPILNGLA